MDRFRLETLDNGALAAINELDRADADIVAEHCKSLAGAGLTGSSDMKHAMSVPGWFIVDWCNKRGMTFAEFERDQKAQNAFLDDPDLAMFRVWKGKV